MSLLDPIVVLDSVLETLMQQEIVLANRTDSASGAGTALNPFNAGGTSTDSDPPFDRIMRSLASSMNPVTVRLLPGTYYTRGFPTSISQGWRPFGGLRIIGSGQQNTTLVRCGTPSSGHNAVIGNTYNSTAEFIDALEISDLTVNATHVTTSGVALSGIAVAGRSILIQRVRVTDMGNNSGASAPSFGISIGRAHSSAPYMPENCEVNECTIDTPNASATGQLFGIHLSSETEGLYHQFCVVRNCYIDLNDGPNAGVYVKGCTGIAAGGGLGTIIERNRILNCKFGITFPNSLSTRDLIIRQNYFWGPFTAIDLNMTSAGTATVGRVIIINNMVEWPTSNSGGYASGVKGIILVGPGGSTFNKVAIRDNAIRRWQNDIFYTDEAIKIDSWSEAAIDNNLLEVATLSNGIQHPNTTGKLYLFNNLKMDGTLVSGYNTGTSMFDQSLESETLDVDMMLFKG